MTFPSTNTALHEPGLADLVVIGGRDGLAAAINPFGAELWWLRDGTGNDLQWNGDERVWSGRAPILFPFIGFLRDGHYSVDGAQHAMTKHGFARHMAFDVVDRTPTGAALRLRAGDATRSVYPFEFELTIGFVIAGNSLSVTATIANHGDTPMPACFGFHPALRWPLVAGAPRGGHTIVFDHAEPQPIRRLDSDGLLGSAHPTPVAGRKLVLRDDLFTTDAIIMPGLHSHAVTYGGPTGPRIRVAFENLPDLAIWTKPGGGFICIEPWHGFNDPADFSGDVCDKPGIIAIAAGAQWQGRMTLTLEPAA